MPGHGPFPGTLAVHGQRKIPGRKFLRRLPEQARRKRQRLHGKRTYRLSLRDPPGTARWRPRSLCPVLCGAPPEGIERGTGTQGDRVGIHAGQEFRRVPVAAATGLHLRTILRGAPGVEIRVGELPQPQDPTRSRGTRATENAEGVLRQASLRIEHAIGGDGRISSRLFAGTGDQVFFQRPIQGPSGVLHLGPSERIANEVLWPTHCRVGIAKDILRGAGARQALALGDMATPATDRQLEGQALRLPRAPHWSRGQGIPAGPPQIQIVGHGIVRRGRRRRKRQLLRVRIVHGHHQPIRGGSRALERGRGRAVPVRWHAPALLPTGRRTPRMDLRGTPIHLRGCAPVRRRRTAGRFCRRFGRRTLALVARPTGTPTGCERALVRIRSRNDSEPSRRLFQTAQRPTRFVLFALWSVQRLRRHRRPRSVSIQPNGLLCNL
mmetsp:Transcript_22350/g.62183  ORF Transcript_22350/g.62183 Transcript_22350/m.62183 type:complete len:437 (+) Transcript_22350:478-1788(+)